MFKEICSQTILKGFNPAQNCILGKPTSRAHVPGIDFCCVLIWFTGRTLHNAKPSNKPSTDNDDDQAIIPQ